MSFTYFFYDLETSGLSPKSDRIMQFAGQRTDSNLKLINQPYNISLKLPSDTLPSVKAILLTGISPLQEGLTEFEFLKIFNKEINIPNTIFVGFNNIRFDDEFIRYLNYRNYYDPYKWHWDQNNSRWDILDLVRMTRALRPQGINWPLDELDKPINKLEALTKANDLNHYSAHDALSDVLATIEVAKLIHQKQPKLFNYLKELRLKKNVLDFLKNNKTFLYTSSHYQSKYLNTALVALMDLSDKDRSSALVYDLRYDPEDFLKLSSKQLAEMWHYDPEQKRYLLPFKTIKLNRSPALAPISTLNKESEKRLSINKDEHLKNYSKLLEIMDQLLPKIFGAKEILDLEQGKKTKTNLINENLYEGFDSPSDQRKKVLLIRNPLIQQTFSSNTLNELYPLFLAYNFKDNLTPEQKIIWKKHLKKKLFLRSDGIKAYDRFLLEIQEYEKDHHSSQLIKDLKKYASAILNEYEMN